MSAAGLLCLNLVSLFVIFGHSDGAFLSFIWVGGGEGGAKHEID